MSSLSREEIAAAVHALRVAAEDEELSSTLQGAVTFFNRRQKQRHKQRQQASAADSASAAPPPAPPTVTVQDGLRSFSSVELSPPHLSRPLYPNPVCFLATWSAPGTRPRRRNLMTISWIAPIDNEGRFFASMNQRRHSAKLLMAHPYLVLSAACAGLETMLTRVGGCTGARVEKASTLGVPLCRPGWMALSDTSEGEDGDGDDDGSPDAASAGGDADDSKQASDGSDEESVLRRMAGMARARGARASEAAEGRTPHTDECSAPPWPSEGELTLGSAMDDDEYTTLAALAGAFAVSPGVAHICAKVTHVRGAHGHYLLTCETLKAFVRGDYWSGKTLERQDASLPPILSFVGSQRFGRVVGAGEDTSAPPAGDAVAARAGE